jgi:single-strand DNA-binding protein
MHGTLGSDAEVRQIEGGRAVISFSVAHTDKWKDQSGNMQERTTWVKCSLWRKSDQVGVAQYLTKGSKVYVEGNPTARAWANAQGQPQAALELTVTNVELGGGAKPATTGQAQAAAPVSNVQHWQQQQAQPKAAMPVASAPVTNDFDDLPF